jgi:hypothetical protein
VNDLMIGPVALRRSEAGGAQVIEVTWSERWYDA